MTNTPLKLLVPGRSGCKIEIRNQAGSMIVRKYAKDFSYNSRLCRQARKQQTFNNGFRHARFQAPEIISIIEDGPTSLSYIDMRYVFAQKYSDYFGKISQIDLESFCQTVIEYFECLIARSRPLEFDQRVFLEKLNALIQASRRAGVDRQLLLEITDRLKTPPAFELLSGRCHGDFTLSNLLFEGQTIYLIDFLDSFVETPVQDIVKFRQDTCFHWSLMLEPELPAHQHNRVKQVLHYLDRRIEAWMITRPEISNWYGYLQVFNLTRILPYATSQSESQFVQQAIRRQLDDELDYSHGR